MGTPVRRSTSQLFTSPNGLERASSSVRIVVDGKKEEPPPLVSPASRKYLVLFALLALTVLYVIAIAVSNMVAPCTVSDISLADAEYHVHCHKFRSRSLAVVVPFIKTDTRKLENWMMSFDNMSPCSDMCGMGQADLVFYNNFVLEDEPEVVKNLTRGWTKATNTRRCFANLRFVSANLTEYEDFRKGLIHRGPRNMFWRAFRLLGGQYDYYFQHEPDIAALRPNWLDRLINETLGEPFWIRGTVHKKRGAKLAKSPPEYWDHRMHVNGAALYSLGDPEFYKGFIEAVAAIPDEGPFDFAVENFTRSNHNWEYMMDRLSLFQYSDFIQNVINDNITAEQILARFPQTYLVHGLGRTPGKCASCLEKELAEKEKADREKAAKQKQQGQKTGAPKASTPAGGGGGGKGGSAGGGGAGGGGGQGGGSKPSGSTPPQQQKLEGSVSNPVIGDARR